MTSKRRLFWSNLNWISLAFAPQRVLTRQSLPEGSLEMISPSVQVEKTARLSQAQLSEILALLDICLKRCDELELENIATHVSLGRERLVEQYRERLSS